MRCVLSSLDSTINGTGSSAGTCHRGPDTAPLSALLKRRAVVREIDHREAVAAVAQLPVQLAEQIVGLRHGVEVAGRLFGLHKLRIFSPVRSHACGCDPIRCRTISCGWVRWVAKTCAVILATLHLCVFIGFEITAFQELYSSARFAMLAMAVSYSPICPRLENHHV